MNTCMAKPRGEKVNYAESARDDAEIRKINPRGHLESTQVKEDDVKVNDVELAVNEMTVEDEGDNVSEHGNYIPKECSSDSDNNSVVNNAEEGPYDPLLACLLYTSPSPRDRTRSRMPSSA